MSAELEPASLGSLVLDSCVVINLFASRQMRGILEATNTQWSITRYTKEREARRVGTGRFDVEGSDFELIDLEPLIGDGVLTIVDVQGDAEAEAYVRFASVLDDGEAQSGAVALGRGWRVATDDAKAKRIFAATVPAIPTVGTSAILHAWYKRKAVDGNRLRTVILDIERRARFRPPRTDPLALWWAEAAA